MQRFLLLLALSIGLSAALPAQIGLTGSKRFNDAPNWPDRQQALQRRAQLAIDNS